MSTAPAPQPSSHPLKVRHFRNLWLGAMVSLFGDQFYLVALPWLVLQLTGSTIALGAILMAAGIPRAVLMLMGGAVSDRVSPRNVMLTTAWSRTFLVGAVAALAYGGALRLSHLYLLAIAFGIADAFAAPAFQAIMPRLLEAPQLPAGNAIMQGTLQLMIMAGPAPAGWVIKRWGVSSALGFDAVSFLFIIVALWTVPAFHLPPQQRKSVWHDMLDGLRYVAADPELRGMMMLFAAMNFCIAGPIAVGLAAVGKFRFGSAAAFGTLLSCFSAGVLVGMAASGVKSRVRHRGPLLLCAYAVLAAGMAVLGVLQRLLPMGIVLGVMGVGIGFMNIQLTSWFQTKTDRAMMGRVMGVLMFSAFGLMPISYAAAGAIAAFSVPALFFAGGAGSMLVVIGAAFSKPVRQID